jgi:hypothetical protein
MPGSLDSRFDIPFDADFIIKDAGLIAADDVWQVGGADKIVDLGPQQFHGVCFINATAVEVDSGNELYENYIQGSNSSTFASGIVNLAMLPLGDSAAMIGGGDTDGGAGFYRLMFSNVYDGTVYRYVRGYTDVTGTIATGINFEARIGRIDRSL